MTPRRFECKSEPTLGNQVGATRALLRLSTELLVEILAYLPAADMISVQRTCRTIRDIIAGTAYLQYTLRAGINGVEDFLLPGVSYSERLELLRRHEQSWDSLQFDLFTKCDILHMPSFTLQDGYLINQHFVFVAREGLPLKYHYTDLCSAARNEDLHWVEVIMRETGNISPFHPRVIFAVDQDLVVVVSDPYKSYYSSTTLPWLIFFEFTTGAPHPLSSIHTVSPPQLSGIGIVVNAEVVGDHVLVLLADSDRMSITKYLIYLVSWKTGTITLLRETSNQASRGPDGEWPVWAVVINSGLVALMDEVKHSLEICELEISTPGPHLRTLCFFEFPPLALVGSRFMYGNICKEWVPTSKHHAQSRSSRGCHLPFYSPTISTIALPFNRGVGMKSQFLYAMVISIPALLSAIPTGVRNVPWVDWGPSSTHMTETNLLLSAGPFWITNLPPLEVRRYDLRRTQYIQSTAEDTSSLQSWPLNPDTVKVVGNSFDTRMPYREVRAPAGDSDMESQESIMDDSTDVVFDREWIIVVTAVLRQRMFFTVYHAG